MSRFEVVLNPFQFETFYHGTSDHNVESIKKFGLKVSNPAEDYELADSDDYIEPGHPPGVYLGHSLSHARQFGNVVFEVKLPSHRENPEVWQHDHGYTQDEVFPHDIPPSLLRQVE